MADNRIPAHNCDSWNYIGESHNFLEYGSYNRRFTILLEGQLSLY